MNFTPDYTVIKVLQLLRNITTENLNQKISHYSLNKNNLVYTQGQEETSDRKRKQYLTPQIEHAIKMSQLQSQVLRRNVANNANC